MKKQSKYFFSPLWGIWVVLLLISIQGAAQTYGGEIQARSNAHVIGKIGRATDNLKVVDSTLKVVLDAINAKITAANTGSVTISTALPAGANNIGDVDVLTVPADPFGVNADAGSATGSISAKLRFIAATGIPVTSLPSVTIGTFPDNEPFNVAQINGVTPLMGAGNGGTGSLRVNIASDQVAIPVTLTSTTITGTVAVTKSGTWDITNAGTFAVQAASATAPVSTMNSASANAGLNSALAGVFDDVAPTAITENSFGFLRMSANRNLFGTIRDAAGNERGANVNASNQLSVSVDASTTLTVNSHAVTNAGTFATQVDGAALTALQLIDNLPNTLGSTTSGQSGALGLGAVTTAAPSYTTAQTNALSLTTAGSLRVDVMSALPAGTANIGDVDVLTLPALVAGTANIGDVDIDKWGGTSLGTPTNFGTTPGAVIAGGVNSSLFIGTVAASSGNGASGTGVLRVSQVNDGTGILAGVTTVTTLTGTTTLTPGTGATNLGKAEDAAHTSADVGIMYLSVRQNTPVALSGADGEYQPPITNTEGALYVTNIPTNVGGLSTYHLVSAATTNATNVKASAGQIYGYYIFNANAAARKVAFHNTAGTPTAGASVAWSIVIPASSGANVHFNTGIAFTTGIGITTTTGTADADATAVAAGDLIINLFYK